MVEEFVKLDFDPEFSLIGFEMIDLGPLQITSENMEKLNVWV